MTDSEPTSPENPENRKPEFRQISEAEHAALYERWERETQAFRDISVTWVRALETALRLEAPARELALRAVEALRAEPLHTSHRYPEVCRDFFFALLGDEKFLGPPGLMACSPQLANADPAIGAYIQATRLVFDLGRFLGREWPCYLD